ncbi:hypothetical protein LUZ60_000296 [Juncus effusus]|nr:hypothetical protein LUZ60_000296 [Juncus effusus]
MEVGLRTGCTCSNSANGSRTCAACSRAAEASVAGLSDGDGELDLDETGVSVYLPRLIAGLISGALTGVFALAGAFTGAVTGALAGRASDSGVLRGAGLGAVAGAVLSIEVLEASRAYWCSERSSSQSTFMADFIEELVHGRFVRDQFTPAVLTAYHWEVNLPVLEVTDENIYDLFGEISSKGLSNESLKKLPCYVFTEERRDLHGDNLSCTICLQDMMIGETVRRLPHCFHKFHLECVDKWLVGNGTCPVCRQFV